MFTREDFEDYFEEIKKKEQQMINMQRELISNIKDPAVKADLTQIMEDELRHEKIVEEIEDIIKVGKPRF